MENKWEVKSHSYALGETGDYDGYWEITNGKDHLRTTEDGDKIDQQLQNIADELNHIGFSVDTDLEISLHCEYELLRLEHQALKEKAVEMEGALKEAKDTINWMWKHMKEPDGQTLLRVDEFNIPANALHIIDLALSSEEGEKKGGMPVLEKPINTAIKKEAVYQFLKYVKTGFEYLRKVRFGKIEPMSKEEEDNAIIGAMSSLEVLLQEFE